MIRLLPALAATAILLSMAASPPSPTLGRRTNAVAFMLDTVAVETAIRDEMRATHTPGAAIAVVIGDRVAYAKGFGVASIESGQPVTPDMLFRVGSVTKMFTGLTAAMLANRGVVDLDTPIRRYAADLHPSLGRLTLDQLLSHTAGMTNEAAGDGPHDDAALGTRMRSWGAEHTFATPGDIYSYSGPGYWLAGYAIERAARAPYADVVAREVLGPLGMTRSTFRPLMAMTWPVALDHRVTNDTARLLRPYPDDVTTWPSGSLFSSVRDLSQLAIALMHDGRLDGRQVIPPAVLPMMNTRHTNVPGGDCGYTYGLSDCARNGVRMLSHYGFRIGSGAVFTVVPEQRVGVIILANRNGAIFGRTERAVLDALLPKGVATPQPDPKPIELSATTRRRFAGVYASPPDTLRLTIRGDSLEYRYGQIRQPVRGDANDPNAVLIVNASGEIEQGFTLVRGRDGRTEYLHDGLNAFRKLVR
jgi:CubicO group peptidase (beta-lactamase class C family)